MGLGNSPSEAHLFANQAAASSIPRTMLTRSATRGATRAEEAINREYPDHRWRRPETSSSSAFWLVSLDQWHEWLDDFFGKDSKKKTAAANNLRKFDAAGRIMETDEGRDADEPCRWCTREGFEVDCKVFAEKNDQACAYCKRHGKSGCRAKSAKDVKAEVIVDDDEDAAGSSVKGQDAQIAALQAANNALENEKLKTMNEKLEIEVALANSRIQLAESELKRISGRLDKKEGEQKVLADKLKAAREEAGLLQKRVANIEAQFETIRRSANALNTRPHSSFKGLDGRPIF